jgi:hypothetical protein
MTMKNKNYLSYVMSVVLCMTFFSCHQYTARKGKRTLEQLSIYPIGHGLLYGIESKVVLQSVVQNILEAEEKMDREVNNTKIELLAATEKFRNLKNTGGITNGIGSRQVEIIDSLKNKLMAMEKIILSPEQRMQEFED